jgi:hypothetical protein
MTCRCVKRYEAIIINTYAIPSIPIDYALTIKSD